ncbi:MAG: hypothetical protein ACE5E7_02595 [Anaerolineae bacterium]
MLRDVVAALLEQTSLKLIGDFHSQVSIDQIRSHSPSHILVEAGFQCGGGFLEELLQLDGVTVVKISLENDQLQIFRRLEHSLTRFSDLADILRNSTQETG